MRNLKKILALVLALMMTVSLMVVASAASYDDYADADEVSAEYQDIVAVLTGMGAFQGDADTGTFRPQETISRAEVSTIIYRVLTGDVEGDRVSLYAADDAFEDVSSDAWYAGYVNYAARMQWVIGVGNDQFDPDSDVTGYEMLAIMLRALGYDQNQEFANSADWQIAVASLAERTGITDYLADGVYMSRAMTREQVAALLWGTINEDKVVYTPANLYVPDDSTIGEDVFHLAYNNLDPDDWGRPSQTWYNSQTNATYYTEEYPYTKYTTPVAECDVVDETGVTTAATYTNGNEGTVTLSANATTATIGEQGRQTYVYNLPGTMTDRIVYIDTFLAQVTDVVASEVDGNGHLDRAPLLELEVYNAYRNRSETVYLTQDTDYTYAVGDMLLVNAYTDSADTFGIAITRDEVEGYVKSYDVANHLEVVQAAESFVGAQTEDWVNAHKHVIDGEEYMDAFRFSLDQTFNWTDEYNETINYNWWLDEFGNIIGVTPLARTGYAVLKDLNWVTGRGGYAEATLVYMDGTEGTVQIDTIDGFRFASETWAWDNATPILRDAGTWNYFVSVGGVNRVQVSEDSTNNTAYLGYALYEVYTNDDGSVELEGVRNSSTLIGYIDDATVNTSTSTISDGTETAVFDGNTRFIVKTGNTYTAYTRATLPVFAAGSVEAYYSTAGAFTQNVYIKSYKLAASQGSHLFTTTDANYRVTGTGIHVMDVVIDGVERTIRTVEDDVINTLMANKGKLFHVTFEENVASRNYGYVTDVTLVNEFHDESSCPVIATAECNYTFAVNVIAGVDTVIIDELGGSRKSWNTTNATTIVNLDGTVVNYSIENIEEAVENLEVGIWVVEDTNGAAAQIYIGTRLTNDDALDVLSISTEGATGEWNGNTYEITIPYNAKECDVTVAAAAQNAVLVDSSDNGYLNPGYKAPETRTLMFNEGLVKGGDSRTATVTVWAEDGVTHTEYTIEVTRAHNDTIDGIIDQIQDNSTGATCINFGTTLYSTLDAAIANMGTLTVDAADDLSIVWDGTPYTATYRSYSNTTDLEAADGADISYAFWQTPVDDLNEYLVIKVTNGGTSFTLKDSCTATELYIVYQIVK